MADLHFFGPSGERIKVSAENPLPISGGAGGGMTPEDITATAPLSWDAETATMSADLGSYATNTELTDGLAGKADTSHTHAAGDVTSGTFTAARIPTLAQSKVSGLADALTDLDRVAAHVADADGTDTTTLAASVDALRDALIAAGLMAAE